MRSILSESKIHQKCRVSTRSGTDFLTEPSRWAAEQLTVFTSGQKPGALIESLCRWGLILVHPTHIPNKTKVVANCTTAICPAKGSREVPSAAIDAAPAGLELTVIVNMDIRALFA